MVPFQARQPEPVAQLIKCAQMNVEMCRPAARERPDYSISAGARMSNPGVNGSDSFKPIGYSCSGKSGANQSVRE